MRQIISITFAIAMSVCGVEIAFAAADQEQPNSQKTSVEAELVEAERLSVQVVKLYQAGKIDEAMPLAKRAIKLREKALGPRHRQVGDAIGNLALLYLAAEKYGDAEDQLKRALGVYEKDSETNAFLMAKTLESLAHVQTLKREFAAAEKLYVRAIALKEQSVGVKHVEYLTSLSNLAALFLRQRDYKRAEPALQRVAATAAAQLGETSREFGQVLERLACAQYKNNQTALAEQTEARANHILYSETARKAEPVKLDNEAFQCRVTNEARPDFTNAARTFNFRGATTLVVAVEADETGSVTGANLVSGDPIFKKAAEKAALSAKLRPMLVDGKPVKINATIVHDYAVTVMTRTVLVPVTVIGRP